MKDHYVRYYDRSAALGTGLPPGTDQFSAGRLASKFLVSTTYFNILKSFPNLELGIGPMPSLPESGVSNPAWIGGWNISLASMSKNPEAAWKFMEFISASQEGSTIWSDVSATMPGYIKSQAFRKMAQDSRWRVFADIAVTTTRFRPAVPSQGVYTTMFGSLLPKILKSEITPIAALEQISQAVDTDMANTFGIK
jgi:ABC-type glycerol-3-phosphate transport system substrate-binding protein